MYTLLITIVIALFVAMLFLNIYFRVKVFKSYKHLVRNNVEFDRSHFFNTKKMEEEVYPKHPEMREEIETFVKNIRYSMSMATVLAILIMLFGAILMWYNNL